MTRGPATQILKDKPTQSTSTETQTSSVATQNIKSTESTETKGVPSPSTSSQPTQTAEVCQNCFHRHISEIAECLSCSCVNFSGKSRDDPKAQAKLAQKYEKKLLNSLGKAMREYNMIQEGDKLMVALSGGKDSLSMLHLLLKLQTYCPVKFSLAACTVDPQHPDYDPSSLIEYVKSLGVPYFYEKQAIMELAESKMDSKRPSFCSFCSRMKRGVLYSACRREGYNVLVMGQHLDDLAESFMMSSFFNGFLRTMKANYHVKNGDLRVIRPMIYIRERDLREYAAIRKYPVVFENCPACFDAPQQRARMKTLLASQEHLYPNLFGNLLSTMKPLIAQEHSDHQAAPNSSDDE